MKHRSLIAKSILTLVCLICHRSVLAQADPDAKTRVLLVGKQPDHPYGTHMYLHTHDVLAKCLKNNGDIETIVSDGWPTDPQELDGVKTIVLYSTPGAEFLLDGPGADSFRQMMQSGVGLVTLHWASSVFEKNLERLGGPWGEYLGGFWVSNYGLSTDRAMLRQLEKDHPICRGGTDYELHDEYYLKPVIKDATPLLQVTTKEQDVVVGWAHERPGGGRSYGTTLGHFYRNFQIDSFRRTVVNAILWTAHQEIPQQGADVSLRDADLELPPKPTPESKKQAAQLPANLRDENLVAWCIVPFDGKKRGPAERAEMLSRLGLRRVAYDWRQNHVPTFEEEILQYKKHGIEYFAFWSTHEAAFELFQKHGLHPQIWRTLGSPSGANSAERVKKAAEQMLPLVERTRRMDCKLGLYNHGGWGGEPDNMIAVCRYLRQHHQADHVGIVYNLHHGHGHIDDFAQVLEKLKPYLLCMNLNGMTRDGDQRAKKILPLGEGEFDVSLLGTIRDSGYDGPIGIIGHTQDDVEQRLQDNLDGLHWMLPQLEGKSPGPKPNYRTSSPE